MVSIDLLITSYAPGNALGTMEITMNITQYGWGTHRTIEKPGYK